MGDTIERAVRDHLCGRRHAVHPGFPWLEVVPCGATLPPHGWKLHVSARPSIFPALVAKLVPLLVDEGCVFKLACSPQALAELNDGLSAPASVGKAFTIYPRQSRVRPLGLLLVETLRGASGPRILSDRRIDDAAPVYYRYGPFSTARTPDRLGRMGLFIVGPSGEEFDGEATTAYRQPPWLRDPFAEDDRVRTTPVDSGGVLGDRYRVIDCLHLSARGNAYRAVDTRSGEVVVVKRARAFVAESAVGEDARARLRNERRVLHAVEDVDGVPRFLDHFRHVADEYLVTTDEGAADLGADIQENGLYEPAGIGDRSLGWLARELARVVAALHDRGVIVRDLAPKNIVLAPARSDRRPAKPSVIDFGNAAYEGLHLTGGTPGYAPARQLRGDPPLETDDLYALGMTPIEAMTGLPPVPRVDAGTARRRALETIRARFGDAPGGLVAAVADLLDDDPGTARHAFRSILTGEPVARPASALPAAPNVTPALVAEVTGHVLDELLDAVDRLLEEREGPARGDASVYTGTAGIGLELLNHRGLPGVPERLHRLADLTERSTGARLGAGLFVGRCGVELFLREIRGERISCDARSPGETDVMLGSAGIGLAHLRLYELDGDPRDLEIARRCASGLAEPSGEPMNLAHGRAGVAALHLALAAHGGPDPDRWVADLAPRAGTLLDRAARHRGSPLTAVAWCNGLTGVARILMNAGQVLGRADLTRLAMDAGDVCATWISRLSNIGQCCGIAGVGDLLIDLARLDGGERHRDHAYAAVRQLLLRGDGSHDRPALVRGRPEDGRAAWAGGLAGILGFLRRLRDGGGPRILPGL